MGRQIDLDKPLSEEDEQWLRQRSRGWQVDEHKRTLADQARAEGKEVEEPEEPYKHPYTVPQPNFSDGSENTGIVPNPVGLVDSFEAYDPDVPDSEQKAHGVPEVVQEDEEVEEIDIDDLHVEDLKDHLRELGESTSGNKAELQQRLRERLEKG